jgi:hypothetical protein
MEETLGIADVPVLLQGRHGGLRAFGILEYADLPQFLSQEVFPGITKQFTHEGVDIGASKHGPLANKRTLPAQKKGKGAIAAHHLQSKNGASFPQHGN